jgi:hypothetical protein
LFKLGLTNETKVNVYHLCYVKWIHYFVCQNGTTCCESFSSEIGRKLVVTKSVITTRGFSKLWFNFPNEKINFILLYYTVTNLWSNTSISFLCVYDMYRGKYYLNLWLYYRDIVQSWNTGLKCESNGQHYFYALRWAIYCTHA